ncbi:unnamed protein product [Didymodactylos carnosus]|uniref:LIM zinc-binding domain-containing protein n=1 Tax=Didymodactylos carnosus TaxID=1234261 RepID=A0A813Y1F4_9BILA|nr:unnamed protein product [Didymodactylos carnosus]CAF0873421.1 unnamed protein product [Didymodactylos carnosus]CAF3534385.1 unnamed protein product [Didymodactylos carnosus]CAF3660609.1 unnamed protein product [Didymodactylos carnosus]
MKRITEFDSKQYHPECFACADCRKAITSQFYPFNNDYLCANCHETRFPRKRVTCKQPISAQSKISMVEGQPCCVRCYEDRHAKRCSKCQKAIVADVEYLEFEDKYWHKECFVCSKCQRCIAEESFYQDGELILCKDYVYCNTKSNGDQHQPLNNLVQSLAQSLSAQTIDIVHKRNESKYYQVPRLECDNDLRKYGVIRRFFRFLNPFSSSSTPPVPPPVPPPEDIRSKTFFQRLKRALAISPPIERFLIRTKVTEDQDVARLLSKTAAVTIYSFVGVTLLGTAGLDTKPLIAGLGITGFTVGFALKEVATNFLSGIFLVINKPFVKGCRLKIHGSGGGIEGFVEYIDVRYVHLRTNDRGIIMIPSAIVYTNPITVFQPDDDDDEIDENKNFVESEVKDAPITKDDLKMKFNQEPVGTEKKRI